MYIWLINLQTIRFVSERFYCFLKIDAHRPMCCQEAEQNSFGEMLLFVAPDECLLRQMKLLSGGKMYAVHGSETNCCIG